ncbi:cytochrome P450 monooxygenase helB3 [Aspergillus lucknowensis]|uniref:Cytochrome P450 n=1 Tax=Aspergillus lucknowensis TaxID=176173 RepID=A0ABR4LHS7_9EURO
MLDSFFKAISPGGYVSILLMLVATRLAWKVVYAFCFSPLRNIPAPFWSRLSSKRGVWHLLTGQGEAMARKDYETYGDVYLCKPNTVYVCDPADAIAVLGSQDFRKTDMYRVFEYDGVPNVSTFTDPVQAHHRRRLLHPFFNNAYLTRMQPLMMQHGVEPLKAHWKRQLADRDHVTVNYRYDTQLAMFDITGALVFGREFRALATNNFLYAKWVGNTLTYMLTTHYFPSLKRFPGSWLLRNLKQSYDDLLQFSRESIAIRKSHLEEGGTKRADLLQAMLDAEDPDSRVRMTSEEVQTESIAMMVGGSESTSSVMSWVIHFLLLHPEHYRRVVDEVRKEFPRDHLITYSESKAKLPYLEACIYETLRCIPTASTSFPRVCDTRGITIKGYYIPPGTEIATNRCAAHIHKESWTDPRRFHPPRFLNGGHEERRNMLSFAYGPRFCIGRNLAWAVMTVTLANLFNDFNVSLPPNSLFGPHNVDDEGRPRIMPTKLGVATIPANPERDCQIVLSLRGE